MNSKIFQPEPATTHNVKPEIWDWVPHPGTSLRECTDEANRDPEGLTAAQPNFVVYVAQGSWERDQRSESASLMPRANSSHA